MNPKLLSTGQGTPKIQVSIFLGPFYHKRYEKTPAGEAGAVLVKTEFL